MCGINGIFDRAGRPVAPELVTRMRDVMIHRGPDDAGVYTAPGIGLGHRRLSIIDLSANGRQPMADATGEVWVTFNGEIYNFEALKRELSDYRFRTRTDTEVILAAYLRWGTDFVGHLSGMFALALWDGRRRQLMLARDHVGKKPLYFSEYAGKVYFASDIKAVLAGLELTPAIDPAALDCYLTYLSVPHHHSIFIGIRKVPPGHIAIFTQGATRLVRYWQLDFTVKQRLSETEALDRLDELIGEAVHRRLSSDVPVGAFLSGGVDSSLVVGMMSRQTSRVRTFSIGFPEQTHNELAYARRVAAHLGTDHHEFVVEPDAAAILPELVWQHGEPFADSSALPSYYLARMTRQQVTVALTGDGGDESFCGYSRSQVMAATAIYRRLVPGPLRRRLLPALTAALVQRFGPRGLVSKLHTLAVYGRLSAVETYVNDSVFLSQREALYAPGLWAQLGEHDPRHTYQEAFAQVLATHDVDRGLGADMLSWLPDDLLVKVDVATMAHSLEARSPLLDRQVIEFAAALPVQLKLGFGRSKYLLKRLAERYVPSDVLYRPKMGFALPIDAWFRTRLRPHLEAIVLGERALSRGYFNPEVVRRLVADHVAGRAQHGHRLWTLLWLELWHQMFVDGTLTRDAHLDDLLATPSRHTI